MNNTLVGPTSISPETKHARGCSNGTEATRADADARTDGFEADEGEGARGTCGEALLLAAGDAAH